MMTLNCLNIDLHPFSKFYIDFFTQALLYHKDKFFKATSYLKGDEYRWFNLLRDEDNSRKYRIMTTDPYTSIDLKYRGIGLAKTKHQWERENYSYNEQL